MSDYQTYHQPDDESGDAPPARSLQRDVGGLLLFAAAIFLGVSVFMSMQRPPSRPTGSTAAFTGLVAWLGSWPLLALSLVMVFLGGRLWVAGVAPRLGRNLLATLVLVLSLSILCGASAPGAGGSFGALLGGGVSNVLTAFVGVPLSLALVLGVIWFAWLRAPDWNEGISGGEPEPSVLTPSESEGLTAEEAEALLPIRSRREEPEDLPDVQPGQPAHREEITGRSIAVDPSLKPLYPPDVRLQGRIPEGARALEPRDESRTPTVSSRPAVEPAEVQPRPPAWDFAPPAPAQADEREGAPATLHTSTRPTAPESGRSADPDLAPAVPRWERVRELEPRSSSSVLSASLADHLPAQPPIVSAWEVGDDDEREDDDESLDLEIEETSASLAASDDEEAEEDETELFETSEPFEALEVEAPLPSAQLEPDRAGVAGEQEPERDEVPLAGASAANRQPGWEQAGLFDDEPVDAYGTPLTLVETLRQSNQEATQRLSGDDAKEPLEASAAGAESSSDSGLFEELERSDESDESDTDEEERLQLQPLEYAEEDFSEPQPVEVPTAQLERELDAESGEPEMVLAPQTASTEPAPAKKARKSKPKAESAETALAEPALSESALDLSDDLVYRAGVLFLERGRVAVSMLQRAFELDFKQATALLDQLQQAGLIGPYLGGQRRDILLTSQEWRERRVGAS
jgi:hypothetical protein